MKLNITAEWDGKEILEKFIESKCKENNLEFSPDLIQFTVFSEKAGKDVNIKPENLKIIYNKTN